MEKEGWENINVIFKRWDLGRIKIFRFLEENKGSMILSYLFLLSIFDEMMCVRKVDLFSREKIV